VLHELTIPAGREAPAAAREEVERIAVPHLDGVSANAIGPLAAALVAQAIGGGHASALAPVRITVTLLPRAVRVEVADPAGPAWCQFVPPGRRRRGSASPAARIG
jgi:hypothetical protein